MSLALGLAEAANVILGAFLVTLAVVMSSRSPRTAARAFLAGFLMLVGTNYMLDSAASVVAIMGRDATGLLHAALVATILDPPLILLFALAATRERIPRLLAWGLTLPSLLLVVAYTLQPPTPPLFYHWSLVHVAVTLLVLYYAAAFVIIAERFARDARGAMDGNAAALFIAFGVAVIPRLALTYVDTGRVYLGEPEHAFGGVFTLAGVVLAAFMATALHVSLRATPATRPHVWRTLRTLGGLLAVVLASWSLLVVPAVADAAFSLTYSIRWVLFAAVLVLGFHGNDLLGPADETVQPLRRAFRGVLVALAVTHLAAILASFPGAGPTDTLLASATIVGVCGIGYVSIRRVTPPGDRDLSWRRLDVYRAYVEVGTPPRDLDAVRERLGLTEADARRVHTLVEVEREAPVKETPAPLAEGHVLQNRYEVRRLLGAGAFGRVFAAWDRRHGERVVLKEVLDAWAGTPEAAAHFRREVSAALRVTHPNLVGFRDLERVPGGHVIVLEHAEGETLRARLARGALAPAEAARVGRDVLAGVAALHAAGLVHRDVKPENVVLRPNGRAVVLDFGAAASVTAATRTRVAPTVVVGTPAYMSPEQARGGTVSVASDVYAVGRMLWESLAGAPYPRGRVPAAWRPVLTRALAADPDARWESADALRTALPEPE